MHRLQRLLLPALAALLLTLPLCPGCQRKAEVAKKAEPRYPNVGAKKVPDFMVGTIYERVEVGNVEPFPVSGWGLAVNLDHTGNNELAPTVVKQFMIKEMYKRGFGSKLVPGYENMSPETVLRDNRVAIVQVEGLLPPGIRKSQTFDVIVRAIRGTATSSLAHGQLYLMDLGERGTSTANPFSGQGVNTRAEAKGFVFVNPAYALLANQSPTGAARAGLRAGVIMDGGLAIMDRPILLQLRQPQTSVARAIEQRIINRFGDPKVASAHDEGLVSLFVPTYLYNTDWQHFVGVALHTYLNASPEFAAAKARQLAAAAQQPDAPLMDISYCWEGIGPPALPFVAPLLVSRQHDVQYAAARAAACIGDPSGAAHATLLEIARQSDNPYQLNAVQTLGSLPHSAAVDHMLRELLDSEKALVRIEAYRILARDRDNTVYSQVITERKDNQKFILDIVKSHGPPLIYATRSGTPRIGIIGATARIDTPITFTAMNNRLSISSGINDTLTLFYRDPTARRPVKMLSNPDIGEIVARLGGIAAPEEQPMDFSYCEIVAILQSLSEQHKLTAVRDGQIAVASFVLQDPSRLQAAIYGTPSIEGGRPQADPRPAADHGPTTRATADTAAPAASDPALFTGRPQ